MSFIDLELKQEYRSSFNDVVKEFYIPVLKEAVLYKRAVGFFSSSSLVSIVAGLSGLIENDGAIQLIASPKLTEEDVNAINDGLARRDEVVKEALIRELNDPKGSFEERRLNLLSNLIAAGKLDIKIALLENHNKIGMFHEKLGLMYDSDNNIIAFSGSMNESANAFETNYEAIDVFTSWSSDEQRVYNKQAAFNAMWDDYEPNLIVLDFPDVEEEIIKRYKVDNTVETNLDDDYKAEPDDQKDETNDDTVIPRIPSNVTMRQYQLDAIKEWENQGFRGIFDMATGTGKTYTALAAITELYNKQNGYLAVLIVCPYQHLVEQWKDDIVRFGMKPIICYSASSQKNWRDRLKTAVLSFNVGVQKHFCMIATNSMFSTAFVQEQVGKLNRNVLLVVDEAHNFGTDALRNTLLPTYPFRLALSATIDRYGDPEGTQILYNYFGGKCIEYTLKEAIDNDMLTPYRYHPVVVSLEKDELEQYLEYTEKIRKNIHLDRDGKIILNDYAKMLLIQRARLVAVARQKIIRLSEIMKGYTEDDHILVYCGAATMQDVDYEEGNPKEDEIRQIDLVSDLLGNQLGMRISQFTSAEDAKERELIKDNFAEGTHLQALIAIRCLDEGVNIPSIKTAFILASSTNPKEYIQRRGRVLRKAPGKTEATIYDFVTLPVPLEDVSNYDSALLESCRSLAKREIVRMDDFANIAENPFESDTLIQQIRKAFDVTLDEGEDNYV